MEKEQDNRCTDKLHKARIQAILVLKANIHRIVP